MRRGDIGRGVDGDRAQAEAARGADDATGDLTAGADEDGVDLPAAQATGRAAPAVTIIRSGVGLKSLHGLFICGQLETRTRMSISARNATRLPGPEMPSTMPRVPSASIGT